MPCGCATLRPRVNDVTGEPLPAIPPREFLDVAATNVVYFALAYYMLMHNNPDGWPVLAVGIVSSIFHSYPTAAAQYVDTAISGLFIAYFAAKYGPRVRNRRLFALSAILFAVGITLLYLNGFKAIDQETRKSTWYMYRHSAWHVLSAAAMLLFLWST